jgi:DNA-binding NarL/FixJ family response regulator
MKTIRILLVDDQTNVRRGLCLRLAIEPDMEVVGEATTGEAALESAETLRPDVVVMDVEMPGMGGIAATRNVRDAVPGCSVVMLSLYDDSATRALARIAGASDFVAKHSTDETLLGAIRRAAAQPPGDGTTATA